jgi:ribosomal protein S27AE
MNPKCSKCGSERVILLVGMMDQGQYSDGTLKALVGYTNPEAWVFKGAVYAKLKANICGECGYTELIAEDPAALYDAYLKAKS